MEVGLKFEDPLFFDEHQIYLQNGSTAGESGFKGPKPITVWRRADCLRALPYAMMAISVQFWIPSMYLQPMDGWNRVWESVSPRCRWWWYLRCRRFVSAFRQSVDWTALQRRLILHVAGCVWFGLQLQRHTWPQPLPTLNLYIGTPCNDSNIHIHQRCHQLPTARCAGTPDPQLLPRPSICL